MSENPAASGGLRPRRKTLIISGAALVAVAAVIAAVIMVTGSPFSSAKLAAEQLKYTSLPAPCAMLTSATTTRYLPGATSSQTNEPSGGATRAGACTWSSISSGEDRTLLLQVNVYDSSSGLSSAQHAYDKEVPASGCQCQGYKVVKQSVSGVGDQATALFTTSAAVKTGPWHVPAINLMVRSGNANINVGYIVAAIGTAPPPPSNAALLAATVTMAHNVLAALARPEAVSAVPAPSQGPRYVSPHDSCTLVTWKTISTYAPGASAQLVPAPGQTPASAPQLSSCAWTSPNASVSLYVSIYPDVTSAKQGYEFGVQVSRKNVNGMTFTGSQQVTGVGQQAIAAFDNMFKNSHAVTLYAWSGTAELQIVFTDSATGTSPPSHATKLAGDIAIARDVLAALPR
jgi:hypothetical protein